MPEEYLDVVNGLDEVVGRATYDEVYAQKLTHRIVHMLVFNDKSEMALQLRSRNKSFRPRQWSTTAGGHVRSGESYEQAAAREFEEELGRQAKLHFVYNDRYYDPRRKIAKFLATFTTTHNGPFSINLEEVEKVEYFRFDQIKEMARQGEIHPELLFLLKKYYLAES